MSVGQVVAGCQDEGAHGGRAGPVIADIAFVEQRMEATGDHSFQQRIFVSVVIIKGGAIDGGGFGNVLHGDFVEALALHEGTQGPLKELPCAPHSWIAYFAVGDGHGSLYIRGYQREKESENNARRLLYTTQVVYTAYVA
jgi:hypothetical protein